MRSARSRLDRSRGGLNSKIHLAWEQGQIPLAIVITAGQRGDSPQFQAVLEAISVSRLGPHGSDRVLANKTAVLPNPGRFNPRRRGIACTIPQQAGRICNRRNKDATAAAGPRSTGNLLAAPRRRA